MKRILSTIIKTVGIGSVIVGAGIAGLATTGNLPQEAYTVGYGFLSSFVSGNPSPFDGQWSAKLSPSITETDDADCGIAQAELIITNGMMRGSVESEFGYTLSVSGTLSENGVVSGGVAAGPANAGSFEAQLTDVEGSGTWKDGYGCYGTVRFVKKINERGIVVSTEGRAFVERGMKKLPLTKGTKFYAHDIIRVEADTRTVISFYGYDNLTITEKTLFEVPEAGYPAIKKTDTVWDSVKNSVMELLQGEDFNIKGGTPAAGVRG